MARRSILIIGMIFIACDIMTASAQQGSDQPTIPNPASDTALIMTAKTK